MKVTRRIRRGLAALLVVLAACTGTKPVSAPSPSPSPSASPTVSRSPSPPPIPAFSARRAIETIRVLVTKAPYREAASAAYRKSAAIVETRFKALGYTVRRQTFAVPGGTCDGIAVKAGTSVNIVAEPPGFDPSKPHLVVGGHLDSVPDTPGANDDASGPAVILELARLARISPTRMPIVFVAFGAEERRRQSPTKSQYALGSRAYIAAMSTTRRKALKGMINIDMVGAGSRVQIIGPSGPMVGALYSSARKLSIPAETHATISQGFSDHIVFQSAGYPVGWLWAGDNPTLHTPRDTMAVIQAAEVLRIGRVAWATLRTLRI
jgi:hypothetical protein